MSDNITNTVTETETETVITDGTVTETQSNPNQADASVEKAHYEILPSEKVKAPEKKVKKKTAKKTSDVTEVSEILAKIRKIILLVLAISMLGLCILQAVFWGFSVKDTYMSYWQDIKSLNYMNITLMAFVVLFVAVFVSQILNCGTDMLIKGRELHFESVSSLFAFYIFSMFVTKLLGENVPIISDFKFSFVLNVLAILIIAYAFVRLFAKDFGGRIFSLVFGCIAIALCIVMYIQNCGNFASFTIEELPKFSLSDLNVYEYFRSAIGKDAISADNTVTLETLFCSLRSVIAFNGVKFDPTIVVTLLQFVCIMVANVLPFVAISMLGYLIYCLLGRNYIQYRSLQTCKKISVMMLVASIFSIVSTVGLYFSCKAAEINITVRINYINMITTVAICIALIIVTSLPWKIYNMLYKHRYEAYRKSEGGI